MYYDNDDLSQKLKIGEIYRVMTRNEDIIIEIVRGMWLPSYGKDFGALTDGTESADNEDSNLELPSSGIGVYRFYPADYFDVRINHPAPSELWRTKDSGGQFKIRPWVIGDYPDQLKEHMLRASEFWVWEQSTPRFSLLNTVTGQANIQGYVIFYGYRWDTEQLGPTSSVKREGLVDVDNLPRDHIIWIHNESFRDERYSNLFRDVNRTPDNTPVTPRGVRPGAARGYRR